jgi:hypothetical protein
MGWGGFPGNFGIFFQNLVLKKSMKSLKKKLLFKRDFQEKSHILLSFPSKNLHPHIHPIIFKKGGAKNNCCPKICAQSAKNKRLEILCVAFYAIFYND